MRKSNRIRLVEPDGREHFITQEQAMAYIRAGDCKVGAGQGTIYLLSPVARGVRGPSCGIHGSARGKGADGKVRLSYLERCAIAAKVRDPNSGELIHDYGTELREIARIQQAFARQPGPTRVRSAECGVRSGRAVQRPGERAAAA